VPDLLVDQLREQRTAARAAQDAVLHRAAEESRYLTPYELAEHGRQVVAEREASDALDAERDRQVAEVRAAATRRPTGTATAEPVLTREQSVYDWLHAGAGSTATRTSRCRCSGTCAAWPPAIGTAPTTSGHSPKRP
jgi:hypothetical protein